MDKTEIHAWAIYGPDDVRCLLCGASAPPSDRQIERFWTQIAIVFLLRSLELIANSTHPWDVAARISNACSDHSPMGCMFPAEPL